MKLILTRDSVRRKLITIICVVTFFALLVNGAVMLVYDTATYSQAWYSDLQSQAEVVGRASIPALQFDDPRAASAYLQLLSVRPRILAAAVYDQNGRRFAEFRKTADGIGAPLVASAPGHSIQGPNVEGYYPILDHGRMVGTVYLAARYQLLDRLSRYFMILAAVMLLSLIAAFALSLWIQRSITEPIISVTEVARRILATRDFSLRAPVMTSDELGYLASSFNAMLEEVTRTSGALLLADRRKDEFLATLAHELRNPLAPLRNGLDILQIARRDNRPASQQAVERAVMMMDRQITQVSRLVEDLLDVSRISTGKLLLRRERVAASVIIATAIETVEVIINLNEHELNVEDLTEGASVDGDPMRLAQIVINLLNNATKYTPKGGHIALRALIEGNLLVIIVSDDGIGIAPETLQEIFEMFHQVDGTLDRYQAGLGVGLSLARTLCELHGGTIVVESGGLGHGSRFTVRLPVVVHSEVK